MREQRNSLRLRRLSYKIATRDMAHQAIALLKTRKGVMIIARDTARAEMLADEIPLLTRQKVLMTGNTSVNLTPTSTPVVLVPYRRATGYTLTALVTIVWTVYPSNEAVKTQLEARIDRVVQTAKALLYVRVLTPLFEVMEEKHSQGKTLEEALKVMVDEIQVNTLSKDVSEYENNSNNIRAIHNRNMNTAAWPLSTSA